MEGSEDHEREERLEALTRALIHRFNNVLMGIQPHVEVIKRAGKGNERVLGPVTQIETALRRAKAIMGEVSSLARPVSLNIEDFEVANWFDSLRSRLQPFSTQPVDLTFDAAPGLVISGDQDQLTRAMTHLIANAVEAMPNGGHVTVRAFAQGAEIVIEIIDSGVGIDPEIVEHVFEPLFTTKRNSAGLGLTVVQQIIEAHGGSVRVDSKPGRGTTITVVVDRG